MDLHLMFPYFFWALKGPSAGTAFALAILQFMTGCEVVPRVGPMSSFVVVSTKQMAKL